MKDKLHEKKFYEQWLAECREVFPSVTLADQIMCQVAKLEHQRQEVWWLCLVQRIERSQAARWGVCGGALTVGSLPFVFLVYVAQLLAF